MTHVVGKNVPESDRETNPHQDSFFFPEQKAITHPETFAMASNLLSSQTRDKQAQLFRSYVSAYEAGSGVKIQKISGAYLRRVLKPIEDARDDERAAGRDPQGLRITPALIPAEHRQDALYRALYDTDTTFSECKKAEVDMLSSFEVMAKLWTEHRASSMAHVLLAWKISEGSTNMRLVGAITVCKSYEDEDIGTHRNLMSPGDFDKLKPIFRANTLLIDCLCSTSPGVGTALVLNAIKLALTKKCRYVTCLSFSKNQLKEGAKPASYKLLQRLGFKIIIPKAHFVRRIYGAWCALDLKDDALPFGGLMEKVVNVCARGGLTPRTSEVLVNRCP